MMIVQYEKCHTTKPDVRKSDIRTEMQLQISMASMKANGESLMSEAREAISSTGGLQNKCNPKTTPIMDITKANLRMGNWNMQGGNSSGKIDILSDECESYHLNIVALTELHWIGQGKTKHGKWEIRNR